VRGVDELDWNNVFLQRERRWGQMTRIHRVVRRGGGREIVADHTAFGRPYPIGGFIPFGAEGGELPKKIVELVAVQNIRSFE
jgi:hypothetical protein